MQTYPWHFGSDEGSITDADFHAFHDKLGRRMIEKLGEKLNVPASEVLDALLESFGADLPEEEFRKLHDRLGRQMIERFAAKLKISPRELMESLLD
jgi:hypothetical protein